MSTRVLVIGLDSAPLELIDPWIQQGKLPNLGRLMAKGATSVLRSSMPPLSPAAWSSFATGMNPGKHGVFDHAFRKSHSYEISPTNALRRGGKTLWEIIGDHGGNVGMINIPETYPPMPVNGFLITGMSTPSDEAGYCYPPSLDQELREAIGGYSVFGQRSKENLDLALAGMKETVVMRLRAAAYLFEKYKPEFMTLVLQETDTVQHRFWKFMDPEHPYFDARGSVKYADAILSIYQRIDENLPLLLDQVDDEDIVIVMSDHGAGAVYKWLFLNDWLVRKGLIQFKKTPRIRLKFDLYRLGFTPGNVMDLAMRLQLGVTDRAVNQVKRGRAAKKYLSKYFLSFEDIDWTRTKAYTIGGNMTGIFINLKGREPQGIVEPGMEYEQLCGRLISLLSEMWDDDNKVKVVTRIHKRDDLYHGPYLDRAPDIVFETHDERYVGFGGQEFTSNVVMAPSRLFNGCHRRDGMLILTGNPIQSGVRLVPHDIIDLAPTILHLMGYPIPNNMDGQVISDAFVNSFKETHPINFTEGTWKPAFDDTNFTQADETIIKDRLKDLGYL